jgi:hypothetical protein
VPDSRKRSPWNEFEAEKTGNLPFSPNAVICPRRFYVDLLCVCFYLGVYFLTSGASSPKWVKPTAEGEKYVFCLFVSVSYFAVFVFVVVFVFVYIAIMAADGKRDSINK